MHCLDDAAEKHTKLQPKVVCCQRQYAHGLRKSIRCMGGTVGGHMLSFKSGFADLHESRYKLA